MNEKHIRRSVNQARYYESQSGLYLAIVLGFCALMGVLVVGHMVTSVMADLGAALAVHG